MAVYGMTGKWLNKWRMGILAHLIGLPKTKNNRDINDRAQRLDFPTGTKRMGLTFTEKIRNHWRPHWFKIHPRNNDPS